MDPASELTSVVVPLEGQEQALDDAGRFVREDPQPMGNGLVVPWVGTSGPAVDGVYVAVVGFGGAGVRAAVERIRLATGSRAGRLVEFAGGCKNV